MFPLVVLGLLAIPSATAGGDAPDRLFTTHGVEIRSDERVFVLFAALNGLGYSEETERKGPPLRAPVFHPIRVSVRDALRKPDADAATAGVRQLFDDNPAEIEAYLEVVLSENDATLSAQAKKIGASALPALDAFRQKAELGKLFDGIAVEQRAHAKELKLGLERQLDEAAKALRLPQLRAPVSLVVVPNPLDAHGSARVVETKDRTYIIAGPGLVAAQRIVLEATLRAAVRGAAEAALAGPAGAKYQKHWESLKSAPKIAARFPDSKSYLQETLARLFTFKIRAKLEGKNVKELEEDVLADLERENLKWARFVMRGLDGFDGSEPLDAALPKLLVKSSP